MPKASAHGNTTRARGAHRKGFSAPIAWRPLAIVAQRLSAFFGGGSIRQALAEIEAAGRADNLCGERRWIDEEGVAQRATLTVGDWTVISLIPEHEVTSDPDGSIRHGPLTGRTRAFKRGEHDERVPWDGDLFIAEADAMRAWPEVFEDWRRDKARRRIRSRRKPAPQPAPGAGSAAPANPPAGPKTPASAPKKEPLNPKQWLAKAAKCLRESPNPPKSARAAAHLIFPKMQAAVTSGECKKPYSEDYIRTELGRSDLGLWTKK